MSYKEQIMSKDKYPSIFSPQMEAIVFIILQIFYATRAVLKIGEYPRIFPSFSCGIFTHVTRLNQSRASENIRWIIMVDIFMKYTFLSFLMLWRHRSRDQNGPKFNIRSKSLLEPFSKNIFSEVVF